MRDVNEPTLADVLRNLWRARTWLAAGMVAGLLCGIVFLLLAVPQYKASMIVTPAAHAGGPDVAAMLPENTGAAMEYVLQNFNAGDSSDFMRFEAIVREPSVAARLLVDPAVRQGLAQARHWRFLPGPRIDTSAKLAAWLQDNIDVEPIGATRLRRVMFSHPDPVFASRLLQAVYQNADDLIRGERQVMTTNRINYLEKTLGQTSDTDHQRDLTKMLMDQEQIAMLLAVHEPFAAALAEPPATGPHADWPRKSIVLPVFLLIGLIFGYILHGLKTRGPGTGDLF